MSKRELIPGAVIGLCALALAGCASSPTTADLMKAHADEAQSQVALKTELAKDWEKGAKLVSSGRKRVEEGEKRVRAAQRALEKAQAAIERGNREIAEGQALIRDSEERFREAFPEDDIDPDT